MYRLAIIEDEDYIRESLAEIIEQEIPSFKVCGLFKDASLIVENISEYDVILSDIRMPNMTGLELAEKIYSDKLKTKIVLISAYADFEYAKQALRYNVVDYLRKPIKTSELTTTFRKIKDDFEHDNKANLKERRNFYTSLAVGNILSNDLEALVKRFEPTLDATSDPICIYELAIENYDEYIQEKWGYGKERLINALYSFFEYDDGFITRIIMQANEYIHILSCDKNSDAADKYILESINDIGNTLGLTISITDKLELPNLKAMLEDNAPFNHTNTVAKAQGQLLFSLIIEKNKELALNLVEKIQNKEKVFEEIIKRLRDNNITVKNLSFDISPSLWIENIISSLNETETTNEIVNQIKNYVYENYQKDLTLEEIAQKLYFNSAYLGRLFKKTTGKSFNEFLQNIRMKTAKDLLLNSNHKIYEISCLVGYNSVKYFSRVFNSYYGITPAELRKRETEWKDL